MLEVTVGSKLDTSIVRIDLKRKRIHSRGRIVEYLNTISPHQNRRKNKLLLPIKTKMINLTK